MRLGVTQLTVLVLALVQCSTSYIWQNAAEKDIYLRNFYRVRAIPPRKVTAQKFATYFLDGDDVTIAKLDQYPGRGRARRANDKSPFKSKPGYYYDIAFLLDSSTSVRRRNFQRALRALSAIIDRGMRSSRYAVITYSKYAKLEFNFTGYPDAKENLKNVKYRPGNTNTEEALRMALQELFENPGSNVRNDSLRRVLLVTDGMSNVRNHLTLLRAFELKASGIELFVVAVGRYKFGMEEIVGMASSTYAHLFRVRSMRGFAHIIKLIPLRPVAPDKTWLTGMHASSFQYKHKARNKRT